MKKLFLLILCLIIASPVCAGPSISGGGSFYGGQLGLDTYMSNAAGPTLLNEAATATNPTLVPNKADGDSGPAWASADMPNVVAGAKEAQRWVEFNDGASKIANFLGLTQEDSVTDGETNGTTLLQSDGAAGDNFVTTCTVGDWVLIYGGTTAADYGVYQIVTIIDDDNLVLDTALTGTNSDVDFYVLSPDTSTVYAPDLNVNGNVGIGTTSPSYPLEILTPASGHQAMYVSNTVPTTGDNLEYSLISASPSTKSTGGQKWNVFSAGGPVLDNGIAEFTSFNAAPSPTGAYNIASWIGLNTQPLLLNGRTYTSAYGVKADTPHMVGGTGTITTYYGLFIGDPADNAGPVTITNPWGVYVDGTLNSYFGGNLDVSGEINSRAYYWVDEFDQGNATDQVDAVGANAAFWTVGGLNENAMADFANGVGGTLTLTTAGGADNDSTSIISEPIFATDSNPVVEFRFKIDNIVDAIAMVGLTTAAAQEMSGTPCTDCIMVGLQEENGVSADAVIIGTNDSDSAGMTYQDTLINVVNDTWVKVKFDITDTEQPRVWVNDTEIAAGQITGTVKATQTLMIYAHVQALIGTPITRVMTIDYIKVWSDRG